MLIAAGMNFDNSMHFWLDTEFHFELWCMLISRIHFPSFVLMKMRRLRSLVEFKGHH